MTNPHFKVVYQGNLRTLATHLKSGSIIETDAPTDNNGKGERFSPTDLLCVSLATCMVTIMGIKAREKNIDLVNTTIHIQKTMADNPRKVSGIGIRFEFEKSLELDNQNRVILERCAHTCPVRYSIHPDIDVQIEFAW